MANDSNDKPATAPVNANNPALNEEERKAITEKIHKDKKLSLIASTLVVVAIVAGLAIWGINSLRLYACVRLLVVAGKSLVLGPLGADGSPLCHSLRY